MLPYNNDKHNDEVARITCSLNQDNIKKILQKLHPPKEIKNIEGKTVDIGENSANWCYTVFTFSSEDTVKQRKLLDYIQNAYRFDVYLNEDEIWFNIIMGEME